MPTYTPDGALVQDPLAPVQISVSRIPTPDDTPTVTITSSFDWKFWAGIAAVAVAGYILLRSMGQAARLPTRRRASRRMR